MLRRVRRLIFLMGIDSPLEDKAQARATLAQMRLPAKKAISWFAVASGIAIGLTSLVIAGQTWISNLSDWLVGQGVLGLMFLVHSAIAVRNQRCAGITFLVSAPIVGFCGGYPQSVLWVPDPHGAYARWADLSTALALWAALFIPCFAVLLVILNRKRAVYLLLVSVLFAGLVFSGSEWTPVLLPEFGAWSAPFFVFGAALSAERGGPGDAGIGAVARHDDRYLAGALIDRPSRQFL